MSDRNSTGGFLPSRPVRRFGKKSLLSAVIAIFTLMLSYGAWWWIVARQGEKALVDWVEIQRSYGRQITYTRLIQSGFPGSVRLELRDPRVEFDGWIWRGNSLVLTASPWAVSVFDVTAGAEQRGRMVLDGQSEPFSLTVSSLRGQLQFRHGQFQSSYWAGQDMEVRLKHRQLTYRVTELQVRTSQDGPHQTDWKIRVRKLMLPQSLSAPLGPDIGHMDISGQLVGNATGRNLRQWLSNWRNAGGRMEIKSLDIGYAPLQVTGEGVISLDPQLQPVGTFHARVRGAMTAVDRLVADGRINPGASLAVKLMLAALSKKPASGAGERYLDLPMVLRRQILFSGSMQLLRLKTIQW